MCSTRANSGHELFEIGPLTSGPPVHIGECTRRVFHGGNCAQCTYRLSLSVRSAQGIPLHAYCSRLSAGNVPRSEQFILHSVQCTPFSALRSMNSIQCAPFSALRKVHSVLCAPSSALGSVHSFGCTPFIALM